MTAKSLVLCDMEKLSFEKRNLLLQLQEGTFAVEAACITGEAAVRADNSVAWNNNGNRVAPYGATHGLRRVDTESTGQLAVGHRLTIRDGEQFRPYVLLECCPTKHERRHCLRYCSGEIGIQPLASSIEYRQLHVQGCLSGNCVAEAILPVKT